MEALRLCKLYIFGSHVQSQGPSNIDLSLCVCLFVVYRPSLITIPSITMVCSEVLAPVARRPDDTIHRINCYLVDEC